MIFQKVKKLVEEFRDRTERLNAQGNEILSQQAELEWANIFQDTIKDKPWLTSLSLSPGRWAANYSLLYILTRVLNDYQPKTVIEFGLGESSKLVDSFFSNSIRGGKHIVIEHDKNWTHHFQTRYPFQGPGQIIELELIQTSVKGFPVNSYKNVREVIGTTADLYLIDGPFGSPRFSRYDIVLLAERFTSTSEFVIILDDYNRQGEQNTIAELLQVFKQKQINIYTGEYRGRKTQMLLATEKYKYAASL
ncbi:MAG: hypothetical protein EOO04_23655 [Chitinophagaceae bacterium]|nr:MAG: hypothetical protein EOO04_23655 [Chitinophagaceae bacterium]